jgi:uncharacterized protein (TIGR02118 family)
MIIRTGLICNRDDVSKEVFERHWRDVHGPLARVVPHLRAYTQNHVLASYIGTSSALHRIDGLSQLWFDDVAAMDQAMATAEQRACVDDIKGFLSAVTIVIQQPGEWRHVGLRRPEAAKVMAVLAGDPAASASYADHLGESFAQKVAGGGRVRVNQAIEHGYIVDDDVPRGKDIVAAIAELWFNEQTEVQKALSTGLLSGTANRLECIAAMHVRELRILEPLSNAAAHRDGY